MVFKELPISNLGQEPSEMRPHVGQHLLLLGLVVGPLLGLFILLPLSLLLKKVIFISVLFLFCHSDKTVRYNLGRLLTRRD